jgi:hypothetical protein
LRQKKSGKNASRLSYFEDRTGLCIGHENQRHAPKAESNSDRLSRTLTQLGVAMTELNRAITCPHYRVQAGSRRCADYIMNGSCRRPDEGMCVEWLKLKHGIELAPESVDSKHSTASALEPSGAPARPETPDLPGIKAIEQPASTPRPSTSPSTTVVTSHQPKTSGSTLLEGTYPIRAVTEVDVASFKAAGLEACIETETLGPVWLVAEYTGQPRRELQIEHAMVLAAVASLFPDARLTAVNRPSDRRTPKSTGG